MSYPNKQRYFEPFVHMELTLAAWRGFSWDSFFAAASMELAALSSSFSAMTVGSSGSTQSVPATSKVRTHQHQHGTAVNTGSWVQVLDPGLWSGVSLMAQSLQSLSTKWRKVSSPSQPNPNLTPQNGKCTFLFQ